MRAQTTAQQHKRKRKTRVRRLQDSNKSIVASILWINRVNELHLTAQDIGCIAYMVFYYGLSDSWRPFLEEKIRSYGCREKIISSLLEIDRLNPELRICQANHTALSAYFRNMYNAIKLIDTEKEFDDSEKEELVKIYRAQLSNP